MTTLESLRPRLRTNDRVQEFVAFAGAIVFASSADFLGVLAGADGNTVDGTEAVELASEARGGGGGFTDFGGCTAGAAVMGPADGGAGIGTGCTVSLPRTSITRRSGSRKVKLVTLLTFPTSNTIRTVELAY